MSEKCDICHDEPAIHQDSSYSRDRKGIGGYSFTSYCRACWRKHELSREKYEQEERLKREERKQKWQSMLQEVRKIHEYKEVPIAYAAEKYGKQTRRSQTAILKILKSDLAEDLHVFKIKNRWKCNKLRVDKVDFEIYNRSLYLY